MKAIAILAATAMMATLAGCDRLRGGGGSANASNATTTNGAATRAGGNEAQGADAGGKLADGGGAVPASSTSAPSLDRTFVMGRWSDDGDCGSESETAIEFTQDGRFIAANGGVGLWNLEGDELTMTGERTATIRIRPIDQDTMTVINADGSLGRSTRC